MNLIVSTLEKEDLDNKKIIKLLTNKKENFEVVYTEDMNIKGCIGCNFCWLKTPGICAIKDDYEKLLKKYLEADNIVFICDTKLKFVSYKLKNIFDRLLPLVTMNIKFQNGQMRHYPRYKKHYKMALIYKGIADQVFLNKWFERAMLNINGKSLGVYNIKNEEEIVNEFINY